MNKSEKHKDTAKFKAMKSASINFLINEMKDGDYSDIRQWIKEHLISAQDNMVKDAFYDAEKELLSEYINFAHKEDYVKLLCAIDYRYFQSDLPDSHQDRQSYIKFKAREECIIVKSILESELKDQDNVRFKGKDLEIKEMKEQIFKLLQDSHKFLGSVSGVQESGHALDQSSLEQAVKILGYNINDLEGTTY